jgi:hypothetical protein
MFSFLLLIHENAAVVYPLPHFAFILLVLQPHRNGKAALKKVGEFV